MNKFVISLYSIFFNCKLEFNRYIATLFEFKYKIKYKSKDSLSSVFMIYSNLILALYLVAKCRNISL